MSLKRKRIEPKIFKFTKEEEQEILLYEKKPNNRSDRRNIHRNLRPGAFITGPGRTDEPWLEDAIRCVGDIIKFFNSFLTAAIDLRPEILRLLSRRLWRKAMLQPQVSDWQFVGKPLTTKRKYRKELEDMYYWLRWALEAYSLRVEEPKHYNLAKNLGIKAEDIISENISSGYEKPAYFLAENKDRKRLVLSIRGTSNLVDWFTDLTSDSEKYEDRYFHEGMLDSAIQIFDEEIQNLKKFLEENENYDLVLTGHSLGAGVASILTFILRKSEKSRKFSDRIKCWAYACPACFDLELVEEYAPFISTFVVQDDIVPRASGAAIEKLAKAFPNDNGFRSLSEFLLERVKEVFGPKDTSKGLVILTAPGTLHHIMRDNSGEDSPDIILEEALDLESNIIFGKSIISEEYKKSLEKLIKTQKGKYELIQADGHKPRFDEIMVSKTMLTDHEPDTYKREMLKILKRYYVWNEKVSAGLIPSDLSFSLNGYDTLKNNENLTCQSIVPEIDTNVHN